MKLVLSGECSVPLAADPLYSSVLIQWPSLSCTNIWSPVGSSHTNPALTVVRDQLRHLHRLELRVGECSANLTPPLTYRSLGYTSRECDI